MFPITLSFYGKFIFENYENLGIFWISRRVLKIDAFLLLLTLSSWVAVAVAEAEEFWRRRVAWRWAAWKRPTSTSRSSQLVHS